MMIFNQGHHERWIVGFIYLFPLLLIGMEDKSVISLIKFLSGNHFIGEAWPDVSASRVFVVLRRLFSLRRC